jgi:hypothetical protein
MKLGKFFLNYVNIVLNYTYEGLPVHYLCSVKKKVNYYTQVCNFKFNCKLFYKFTDTVPKFQITKILRYTKYKSSNVIQKNE